MINKKKLFKSLIIMSLIIVIIIATVEIRKTLARYETTTTGQGEVDVAFWIVNNSFQSQRLLIDDIYPSTNTFEYTFTVSNFNGSDRAETDLEYELTITATTNLPLSYSISREGTTCTKVERLYTDEDGTYHREIKLGTDTNKFIIEHDTDKADTFVMSVTFPKQYSSNSEYADLMENIEIELTAKQIIEE